ncbi:transforming acidic coiled-coil-containing protein 1 isoform X3 [Polypterus senegalus]|uniref:transforming acidic coiled-coil-containing protein 1 isoform X3 n=1 Tax=Polypterus senegalus TaxID=55291 RepID=UPI00196276D6|nr:transforming acidic coiled-coil-containing protein 1 isoform X3 [Polypterus senegalus]
MAFSPWQMLSPVQWAKWTWSAVRGGGEDGQEGQGGAEEDVADEEEDQSLSCSSDSEGNFETPEAETPVHGPQKELQAAEELDIPSSKNTELQRDALLSNRAELLNSYLDKNSNKHESTHDKDLNNEESFQIDNTDRLNNAKCLAAPLTIVNCTEGKAVQNSEITDTHIFAFSILPQCQNTAMFEDGKGVAVDKADMLEPQKEETATQSTGNKTKTRKNRLPCLKIMTDEDNSNEGDEYEISLPKASYKFDPCEYNESINPFTSGGSKLQNSPPPSQTSPPQDLDVSKVVPVKLEFDFTDNNEGGEVKRPASRKLGKKLVSKLTPKKQTTATKPAEYKENEKELPASQDLDETPIIKSSCKVDPSQWDDPNFNPFGGNAKSDNSNIVSKGSYNFNPDNSDDSLDPFKSSKTMVNLSGDGISQSNKHGGEVDLEKLDTLSKGEEKIRKSPKNTKSRLITTSEQVRFLCFLLGACKVKKYENQSLILDICTQENDEVKSKLPDIAHREGHATDEEKLASTTAIHKPGSSETKAEIDEEFFECSNIQAPLNKTFGKDLEIPGVFPDSCLQGEDPSSVNCTQLSSENYSKGSPVLDSICISEADKAAVLTLIREEIITKEMEAIEWKRKYQESKQEVIEMRKIVTEYEKTIAQMIEDEQRQNSASQKSIQQLTAEKDQAVADLNSVERSLSDLFRRYENMKGILEGFKKNEEVLKKCAQDYLARVKQEEQRYCTLKIHAEEKLDKANEEIAQVRAKSNSESMALNAALRKEQMKVDSLERALQQKNQEIEELTKICDELIAKLGKTD